MSVLSELMKWHHPELLERPESGDGGMVCQIWEDGEVTLQKGGSLLGQRNLHMIVPPCRDPLPLDQMPIRNSEHGFVVVRYIDRDTVRDLIKNWEMVES